jgi:serine/threonine-protein kinase PpkA
MDETIHIPGYVIEKSLGSGAMATVYLATQRTLERKVALKIMAASLVADATFRERFLREGKVIAQLTHPNIVTIYDIGAHGSCYYMAMQYIDGGMTLKDRIGQGLPADEALDILVQIASALGYAHKRHIIHRDVKPANILFNAEGAAILSDFGIAKTLGEGTQLTQQGFAVGTPAYMSPEQILGKGVDTRSDLYSLGILFYEMLTGNKPYHAEDTFALALMQVNEAVPRLPANLSRYQNLVDRLMAKNPAERFADAAELIRAVSALRTGAPLEPTRMLPPDLGPATAATAKKPAARWPVWVLGGGAAIGLAGVVLYLVLGPMESACQSPALTPQQQTQIAQLLENAQINSEFKRLVYPPFSNAAYLYDQILQIDPCHSQAKQSLQQIPDAVAAEARKSYESALKMQAGEEKTLLLSDTLALVKAALDWAPQHPELQQLQQDLDQALRAG